MEFHASTTEKEQRGCHRLPGSGPGRRRGRTHSSRASPGVRLPGLACPALLKAGRGFPQAPSPSAACWEPVRNIYFWEGPRSACLGREVEAAPWPRKPGRRRAAGPVWDVLGLQREGSKLRELRVGGGGPLWGQGSLWQEAWGQEGRQSEG